jgi:hypothetical protein
MRKSEEHSKDRAVNSALEDFIGDMNLNRLKDFAIIGQLKIHFDCLYSLGFSSGAAQNSKAKQVEHYRNGKLISIYPSCTVAARMMGVSKDAISKHCKGKVTLTRSGTDTFKYRELCQ